MQAYYLSGEPYEWKPKGKEVVSGGRPCSNLHKNARILIKDRFPTLLVLEEVEIKPYPKIRLFLDFFLPMRMLAIEVHGQQHYKYNSMFHKSRADFLKQKKNDRLKTEWCDTNGVELLILPYNMEAEWTNLI